jgi:hypothetical protein
MIATQKAAGFEKVCKAAKDISTCLGDQMEACFAAQHLEGLGIPASDVLIYREMQAALASECVSGYDVIHDKIECMISTAEEHQSEFGQCATDFQRNVQRDPSRVCDYAQTFLRCNSDIFQQGCGSDLSAATCNAMKAEINVPLPTCKNLTCVSEEDVSLIEGSTDFLSGRQSAMLVDFLGDALPASVLQRQQQTANPAQEDDSDSSSDDQDNDNDQGTEGPRAKCNDRKFGQCLKAYAQQLGMKSFPQDPAEYGKAVSALVQKYGKVGFKKICASSAKLGRCLGRQQIFSCINLDHLIELGLTKAQAMGYISITKILAFECTKGYKVIYNNWDCIVNTSSSSNETFVKCQKDFEKKIKKDPKNVCKYSQGLVNCDVKPFAQKCSRQVSTTICQLMQIPFKQALPKCQIKCGRQDDDDFDEMPAATIVPAVDIQDNEDQMADMLAS